MDLGMMNRSLEPGLGCNMQATDLQRLARIMHIAGLFFYTFQKAEY